MPISIEELRRRRRELEADINKFVREKEHIDYVLRHFAKEGAETAAMQLNMQIPADSSFKYRSKDEKLQAVIDILKTTEGNTQKSGVIHRKLEEKGIILKKTTFDAYMSMWVDNPETHIVRTGPGMYKYSLTGVATDTLS